MKFCIATVCSEGYRECGAVSGPNVGEYAKRHGYDYHVKRGDFVYSYDGRGRVPTSYERFRWFLELLKTGKWDWLLGLGADVMITNMTLPLDRLADNNFGFVISCDALMVQSDGVLIKNTPAAIAFVEDIVSLRDKYADIYTLRDLLAIEEAITRHPGVVKIVPQREVQSYEYARYKNLGGNYTKALDCHGNDGQWQPGDFALHVPAGLPREKADELRRHLERVIR